LGAEAGGLRVPDQPEIHSILSKKKKTPKTRNRAGGMSQVIE
jgi:hypothetical protein